MNSLSNPVVEQWREPSLKIRFKTRNGEFALVESGQEEIRVNFTTE